MSQKPRPDWWPTEAQLELLRDKHSVWRQAELTGPTDLRDYNRRCAEALKNLLCAFAGLQGLHPSAADPTLCPACEGEGPFETDEAICGDSADTAYFETCEECGGSGLTSEERAKREAH